jgi:hypothetical protein
MGQERKSRLLKQALPRTDNSLKFLPTTARLSVLKLQYVTGLQKLKPVTTNIPKTHVGEMIGREGVFYIPRCKPGRMSNAFKCSESAASEQWKR